MPAPQQSVPSGGWFAAPVAALAQPLTARLRHALTEVPGLTADERRTVFDAGRTGLLASLQLKLNRVLLLELHAARLAGELDGGTPAARWDAFLAAAATAAFRDGLDRRYPALTERVTATGSRYVTATVALAARLSADRAALGELLGRDPGGLRALEPGVGDSHRGGHAVARVEFDGGTVMYKPRPVESDAALRTFLRGLGDPRPLRVPRVLVRDGYGWAEHIAHRYCGDEDQLAAFYADLGRWLAVMRLLGGTDLHSENLIAYGPEPVVVDAEALFTPDIPAPPSGRGDAVDIAARTIRTTVLRTGILPLRADGYALAGVDVSAAGALPGQQPRIRVPVIAGGGTDTARMEMDVVDLPPARNHPAAEPVLIRHWDQVVAGFRAQAARLTTLQERGELASLLAPFAQVTVRRIRRPTQAYTDIARMLWHPACLHDPAAGRERGRDILRRNAAAAPGAPADTASIEGEIDDLLAGDIPVFTRTVTPAMLEAALDGWRTADLAREEDTIRSALVGAYLNERQLPARVRIPAADLRADATDTRRRALAASAVRDLATHAVRGEDGTATWISPVLTENGWAIRPLTADLYSGQGGVALALAAYVTEQRAGRADPVDGTEHLLSGALRVLAATEEHAPTRTIGGYTGLASQVWTWCALHQLLDDPALLDRARARAALLNDEVIGGDKALDLLSGAAGVIVPLIGLAELTGEERWLAPARTAAAHLARTAVTDARGVRWSTAQFAEGIGGLAHGATGIGWALARLALVDGSRPWADLAARAFAFEESLYDADTGAWRDARLVSEVDHPTAWCHGSTGIGLAAADLHRRTGDTAYLHTARRAVPATLREGFGFSHTLCHGDLGLWELLETVGGGPGRRRADAEILTGIEERGPVGGLAREAFSPGLMPGLGGVVHALLRMHPDHRLPDPLTLTLLP